MLPQHTAVRVTETTDERHGKACFVLENKQSDEGVPEGYVMVVFDPLDVNGALERLYSEDKLTICGC